MAEFHIRAGDRLPVISATITDGRPAPGFPNGTPVNLSSAAVRFLMRILDHSRPMLDASASITDPEGGRVSYSWAEGDTATPGTYLAEWQITFDGRQLTVPNGEPIAIAATPGVEGSIAIDTADLRAIRAHIGKKTPPTDAELAEALARLGSVDAVALEVLDERLADMVANPAKWAVEGDFSLDNTTNLKVLAGKVDELRSVVSPSGGGLALGQLTRADPWR